VPLPQLDNWKLTSTKPHDINKQHSTKHSKVDFISYSNITLTAGKKRTLNN
jgi:hypothetical protein